MLFKKLIPQSIKNIYHLIQAVLANFWYGFPSRKIKVIGVTGTNGKTTTAQMIAKILEEAGHSVAMISTINFKLGDKEWINKTKFTTLSSRATQKFIKQAVNAGCEYLVLETSSHSLDQNRVWGVKYGTAVITNITREHLDYHKTMEKYRRAKLALFKKAKNIVVNLDMEHPEEFISGDANKMYGYGVEIPNSKSQILNKLQITNYKLQTIIAEDIKLGTNYSKFKISAQGGPASGWQNSKFKLHLPGKFNIENALAAVCAGLAEGIDLKISAKALEKIKGIPGRLENVPNNKGLNIIIDYAVTPDSLEKLYELISEMKNKCHSRLDRESRMKSLVSEITLDSRFRGNDINHENDINRGNNNNKKIISVFGACGERDRGKRPIMGEIVSRFADYIIITNEDPYNEDPQKIIDEVFSGVVGGKSKIQNYKSQINSKSEIINSKRRAKIFIEGKNCWRILDRKKAIKKALRLAKPGDFVVITGKGAEETMAVGNKRIPWNDKKVVMRILAS
ncbi:UDP-N-acetylmuramoyl-L-alanyl-D-glutamate--2,6-diaminopimelate ligase [bacterium]|nr:UDP-N-acetylmuramoyl-L-alanyl-D-glutamate--2,6-diaminopimelate ligase [bacterium]